MSVDEKKPGTAAGEASPPQPDAAVSLEEIFLSIKGFPTGKYISQLTLSDIYRMQRFFPAAAPTLKLLQSLNKWASEPTGELGVESTAEHEKTRKLISDKLEEVAKKEDIIEAKDEIICSLRQQISELEGRLNRTASELAKSREVQAYTEQLAQAINRESEEIQNRLTRELEEIHGMVSRFAPHKRFFRAGFGLFCFFSGTLLVDWVMHVTIMQPFWAALGSVITAALLVLSYFAKRDLERRPAN